MATSNQQQGGLLFGDWIDTSPAMLRAAVVVLGIAVLGWVLVWDYLSEEPPPPAAVVVKQVQQKTQERLAGRYRVTIGHAAATDGLGSRWFYADLTRGQGSQTFSIYVFRPGVELRPKQSRIDRAGTVHIEVERLSSNWEEEEEEEVDPDELPKRDPLAGPQDAGPEATWSHETWKLTGRPVVKAPVVLAKNEELDEDDVPDFPPGFGGSAVVVHKDGHTSQFTFKAVLDEDVEEDELFAEFEQRAHEQELEASKEEPKKKELTGKELAEIRTFAPPSQEELKKILKATKKERRALLKKLKEEKQQEN